MTFEAWKSALMWDARANGFERKIEALTDYVLFILWEDGVGPTISEIMYEEQKAA